MDAVGPNDFVSIDRPKSGCHDCNSFTPERDNWGLARISQEDALPEHMRWPFYLYEKEDMDVDIYVLDTGILETHEEFEPGRASWGFTAIDAAYWDRNLEFGPDYDYNGHGTHVAGTAAGNKYGVAKTAKVIAVKVLASDGIGTYADIMDGLILRRSLRSTVEGSRSSTCHLEGRGSTVSIPCWRRSSMPWAYPLYYLPGTQKMILVIVHQRVLEAQAVTGSQWPPAIEMTR